MGCIHLLLPSWLFRRLEGSSLKSVAVTFGVTRKQIKIAVFRYDVINFLN